ncbi:Zinc finger FYVE domain-containing protein 1 [Biomphalaria glabrata]|nr:zinc finger FYVE domain-containing protein 1-like [Biomphalaria glabrata]
MMRPNIKRRKSRSSLRICEEKFLCSSIDPKAKYYCEDCKTAQCQECVVELHKSKLKYDFHKWRPLGEEDESRLCQAKKISLVCQDKNYPDVWCENCKIQLCYPCFDQYHSIDKRKNHINVSIAYHLRKEKELKEAENHSSTELYHSSTELYQDAVADMIQPVVPYATFGGDNSMTFYSFPQSIDSTRNNMAFTSSNTSIHSDHSNSSIPDLCLGVQGGVSLGKSDVDDSNYLLTIHSFLLVDDQEILQVGSQQEFLEKLGCDKNDTFKVVSVFGNTGDGKSHTLNHVFFEGREIFKTSPSQSSCTLGVWCALAAQNKTIVLDTEGLLGSSSNENQRTRLLLKILAVSDIVIYRTRAERLHNDMFVFLSSASKAYCNYFKDELTNTSKKNNISTSSLGPSLIVFQETLHTEPLRGTKESPANAVLRGMFYESKNPVDAFHETLHYVGIRTTKPPTNFSKLKECIHQRLGDNSVRASRRPEIIFQSLKALNDKFSGKIETPQFNTFPDEYFTCTSKCMACKSRCKLNMNHDADSEPHDAGRDVLCEYQSQYGNKVFMCKKCLSNKKKVIVVPKTSSSSDSSWLGLTKYIWSGYVYECPNCGIIYRSREHWYGNEEEEKALHVEYRHVWPQGPTGLEGSHNAARKVIDGFHYVANTISSVGARPTKYLGEWTADQINPSYWVPNSEIIKCSNPECQILFDCAEQKHHCRACGKGFCSECSSKKRPVPERGWGDEPVRVCDSCYSSSETEAVVDSEGTALTARKVGEAVTMTFSVVASALDYPIGIIKSSARPAYWTPDEQIKACCVCEQNFGPRLAIHHCRACGQGVCENCSPNKRPVPLRGWDYAVRVCTRCEKKKDVM